MDLYPARSAMRRWPELPSRLSPHTLQAKKYNRIDSAASNCNDCRMQLKGLQTTHGANAGVC